MLSLGDDPQLGVSIVRASGGDEWASVGAAATHLFLDDLVRIAVVENGFVINDGSGLPSGVFTGIGDAVIAARQAVSCRMVGFGFSEYRQTTRFAAHLADIQSRA